MSIPPTDPPGRSPRCDARVCTHVTCRWERGEDLADAVRAYFERRATQARDPSTHGKIVCTPDVLHGKPRIDGTRISVEMIVGMRLAGASVEELLREYPSLVREDVSAAVLYELQAFGQEFPR